MTKPNLMPTKKPAKAPKTTDGAKRFSLVPAAAQQEMYEAISRLKRAKAGAVSGAEIAEIAVCVALGERDPVIPVYAARGARTVRKGGKLVGRNSSKLAAATISAAAALLADAKATALVCAGKLEAEPKAQEDFRSAFRFAARHKLPILYLVANTLAPGRKQELDLRPLHADFGIPIFSVDANDAIAAYRVATEALHNARHQRGPCVIEALTLLGKDGCPPHSPEEGGYGPPALELLRSYMERHGNWAR
jgi:TPP-dependent pyruvate/acetoin dehydrogenase alpha subunit